MPLTFGAPLSDSFVHVLVEQDFDVSGIEESDDRDYRRTGIGFSIFRRR